MGVWSSRRTRASRGAYNQNVIKEAEKLLAQHPDTKLYVVGEYGRRYFDQHKIPIEHSFLYTAQNPTLDRAREISALLLDGFFGGNAEGDLRGLHRYGEQSALRGQVHPAAAFPPDAVRAARQGKRPCRSPLNSIRP